MSRQIQLRKKYIVRSSSQSVTDGFSPFRFCSRLPSEAVQTEISFKKPLYTPFLFFLPSLSLSRDDLTSSFRRQREKPKQPHHQNPATISLQRIPNNYATIFIATNGNESQILCFRPSWKKKPLQSRRKGKKRVEAVKQGTDGKEKERNRQSC